MIMGGIEPINLKERTPCFLHNPSFFLPGKVLIFYVFPYTHTHTHACEHIHTHTHTHPTHSKWQARHSLVLFCFFFLMVSITLYFKLQTRVVKCCLSAGLLLGFRKRSFGVYLFWRRRQAFGWKLCTPKELFLLCRKACFLPVSLAELESSSINICDKKPLPHPSGWVLQRLWICCQEAWVSCFAFTLGSSG